MIISVVLILLSAEV